MKKGDRNLKKKATGLLFFGMRKNEGSREGKGPLVVVRLLHFRRARDLRFEDLW